MPETLSRAHPSAPHRQPGSSLAASQVVNVQVVSKTGLQFRGEAEAETLPSAWRQPQSTLLPPWTPAFAGETNGPSRKLRITVSRIREYLFRSREIQLVSNTFLFEPLPTILNP